MVESSHTRQDHNYKFKLDKIESIKLLWLINTLLPPGHPEEPVDKQLSTERGIGVVTFRHPINPHIAYTPSVSQWKKELAVDDESPRQECLPYEETQKLVWSSRDGIPTMACCPQPCSIFE